ncbi:hypothetical protein HA466_0118880 [Hirschfeldia incana]|nr:hypothetical protein HA466_0118880 [Hirschfeldia incana]
MYFINHNYLHVLVSLSNIIYKRRKALTRSLAGQYDYSAKFSSHLDKLKSPFTISIGQSTLESNDLYKLVHRSTLL